MKKSVFFFSLLLSAMFAQAANPVVFSLVSNPVPGSSLPNYRVEGCTTIFGDYNNDGLLDIFYVGGKDDDTTAKRIGLLKNIGNTQWEDVTLSSEWALISASAVWIDYDNDGDLDIICSGSDGTNPSTFALKNSGAPDYTFSKDAASSFMNGKMKNGTLHGLATIDYNNDGWMDVAYVASPIWDEVKNWRSTRIFINQGGYFSKSKCVGDTVLSQCDNGNLYVSDFNSDGYADLTYNGYSDTDGYATKMYSNNSGDGTFTALTDFKPFQGEGCASIFSTDVNNDGYQDFVHIYRSHNDWQPYAYVWLYDGSTYKKVNNCGITGGSAIVSVGDVNNDGNMDIFYSSYPNTRLAYGNGDGTFTEQSFTGALAGFNVYGGYINLVDLNGDNTLDIHGNGVDSNWKRFNVMALNTTQVTNNAPTAPQNFTVTPTEDGYTLAWESGTDDHTPDSALRYNIYASNDEGQCFCLVPVDLETGKQKVGGGMPYYLNTTTYTFHSKNFSAFGVQTIDGSGVGSEFVCYKQAQDSLQSVTLKALVQGTITVNYWGADSILHSVQSFNDKDTAFEVLDSTMLTISVEPKIGFTLSSIIVNGEVISPDSTYIVHSKTVITATFDAPDVTYTCGEWQLTVSQGNGAASLKKGTKDIFLNSCGTVRIKGGTYDLSTQAATVSDTAFSDLFGQGKQICVVYYIDNTIVTQTYNLYEDLDYILTRIELQSDSKIYSNYIVPIQTTTASMPLSSGDNRALFVPFDNDNWIRYNSVVFPASFTSNEVGVLYNATTLEGLVIGSIEHTDWKTGVILQTSDTAFTRLSAYNGYTSSDYTHDALAHGNVYGKTISSSPVFIGFFSDWRMGLETFGDANAMLAPKREWNSGKPFIWNSWGVVREDLTYMSAAQNALFVADSLVPRGYQNEGTMYMCLDSYWDNLSSQCKQYADFCHNHGLKAGIYWGPFVDWDKEDPGEGTVPGTEYQYKDIWLYVNGSPFVRNGAYGCDPTHPGTKKRMETYFKNFHDWGFDFVKLDFMVHGIIEADSWYDKSVTTGVQAYNQAMRYIDSLAGDMYINLSISPVFPANYAQGRRIACDAVYGSTWYSEYELNATTYGWWLDHVYSYNDADYAVFFDRKSGSGVLAESVNRVRLLSTLVTGIPDLGDDFSKYGDQEGKERAKKLVMNKYLMQMARQTHAFRPLESAVGTAASTQFYTMVEDTAYVALFNYSSSKAIYSFDLSEVGLQSDTRYTVLELMQRTQHDFTNTVKMSVPAEDCLMLKIYPYTDEAVDWSEPFDPKPEAVEYVHSEGNDAVSAQKFIRDNQLLILRNGELYDAHGRKME